MKDEIEARLTAEFSPASLNVQVDGNHCSVTVVSDRFDGLSKVKRQQLVYACLNDKIASGEIHAINISAVGTSEQ